MMQRDRHTVLVPGLEDNPDANTPATPFIAYGSGPPLSIICLRRTREAATMANVVRTAPIPQENTSAVFAGSVSRITRKYASR